MLTEASIHAKLDSLSSSADCRRRRVGALLVKGGELVGIGWNGLPHGSCTKGDCPRGMLTYTEQPKFVGYENNCEAIHAETSAIKDAGDHARGAKLYVTCEPCGGCVEAIAEAGITDVVVYIRNTDDLVQK